MPARRPDPAVLDGVQLPLTAPASQSLWLADDWIESSGRAASPTG
ncbi:hypothetical protein [Micromonospora sp. NBC_01638]|nr:hypothetical protein OG811_03365 [Micromonospora sp. NBC_01638]